MGGSGAKWVKVRKQPDIQCAFNCMKSFFSFRKTTLRAESPSIFLDQSGRGSKETLLAGYRKTDQAIRNSIAKQ